MFRVRSVTLARVLAAAVILGLLPALPARAQDTIDETIRVEFTSLTPGQRVRGPVNIVGFAADPRPATELPPPGLPPLCRGPREPNGICVSGINERDVRLYLHRATDGSVPTDDRNLLGFARTGLDAPAARALGLGPRYDKSGFALEWQTCSFAHGPYTLWVWASSLVQPGARNYATLDLEIEPCAPATALDADEFAAQTDGVFALRLDRPVVRGEWRDPVLANFAAGIDARCPRPLESCRYGLHIRELLGPGEERSGSTSNATYRFLVDPSDGTYFLGYLPPGEPAVVTLLPWTPAASIARGSAVNRLGVIAQDDSLQLLVNGQPVGETRDGRLRWGQLGWIAETDARDRGVQAEFDNLAIVTPDAPAALASVLQPGARAAFPRGQAPVRDDFREPTSGWPQRSPDPANVQFGYLDGEYQVVKQSGPRRWAAAWLRTHLGDFEAEVDARLLAPTAGGMLHLGFRLQDNEDHYSFIVDPNAGTWSLGRLAGGQMTLLVDRRQSAAIQREAGTNRLGVRAQGPELVLRVNGQEVGRARDEQFRGGGLVLGVASRDDARIEGRFSNLVVQPLD